MKFTTTPLLLTSLALSAGSTLAAPVPTSPSFNGNGGGGNGSGSGFNRNLDVGRSPKIDDYDTGSPRVPLSPFSAPGSANGGGGALSDVNVGGGRYSIASLTSSSGPGASAGAPGGADRNGNVVDGGRGLGLDVGGLLGVGGKGRPGSVAGLDIGLRRHQLTPIPSASDPLVPAGAQAQIPTSVPMVPQAVQSGLEQVTGLPSSLGHGSDSVGGAVQGLMGGVQGLGLGGGMGSVGQSADGLISGVGVGLDGVQGAQGVTGQVDGLLGGLSSTAAAATTPQGVQGQALGLSATNGTPLQGLGGTLGGLTNGLPLQSITGTLGGLASGLPPQGVTGTLGGLAAGGSLQADTGTLGSLTNGLPLQAVTGTLGGLTSGLPLQGLTGTLGGVNTGLPLQAITGTLQNPTGALTGLTGTLGGLTSGLPLPAPVQGLTGSLGGLTNGLPLGALTGAASGLTQPLQGVLGSLNLPSPNAVPQVAANPPSAAASAPTALAAQAQTAAGGTAAVAQKFIDTATGQLLDPASLSSLNILKALGDNTYIVSSRQTVKLLSDATSGTPLGGATSNPLLANGLHTVTVNGRMYVLNSLGRIVATSSLTDATGQYYSDPLDLEASDPSSDISSSQDDNGQYEGAGLDDNESSWNPPLGSTFESDSGLESGSSTSTGYIPLSGQPDATDLVASMMSGIESNQVDKGYHAKHGSSGSNAASEAGIPDLTDSMRGGRLGSETGPGSRMASGIPSAPIASITASATQSSAATGITEAASDEIDPKETVNWFSAITGAPTATPTALDSSMPVANSGVPTAILTASLTNVWDTMPTQTQTLAQDEWQAAPTGAVGGEMVPQLSSGLA